MELIVKPALIIPLLDTSDRSDTQLTLATAHTAHTLTALITAQCVQMRSRARYTTWTNTETYKHLKIFIFPVASELPQSLL